MELSFKEIFHLILRKWWLLMLCIIICGFLAGMRAYYLEPVYEGVTTLYVGKNADEQGVSYTDLNIGASVVLDYQEIAKSRIVASTTLQELGDVDLSVDELSKKISVNQKTDTRVIEITVIDTDPELAMILTNKVADVFRRKITEIMQVENVVVIDVAELPRYPVSPSTTTVTTIGLLVGGVLGVGIIFLIAYLDNTIKTPDDVKKHLGIPVLGTIPAFHIGRKD